MTAVKTPSPRSPPKSSRSKGYKSLVAKLSSHKQKRSDSLQSTWKPNAFRVMPLVAVILASWALIAVLQWLLQKSQSEGGVILAGSINEIPFGQSFMYRYLPTIIALIYSIFWSWIDLQVKRLEPYHQLSKPGGAWGKDSLLLSYPFDFLPFVPWTALKRRHWAVFWASASIMFTTWGIVPVQAGIFSSETIQLASKTTFSRSTGYLPASEQSDRIDARYIYSTHGIIWLNESLPPFMTRDYALAPFQPDESTKTFPHDQQTWTFTTTLYSLDMKCEIPGVQVQDELQMSNGFEFGPQTIQSAQWISSNGCGFPTNYYGQIGNETQGPNRSMGNQSIYATKEFASIYIGQYSTDWSDYYLETYCPVTANHTFMAWFTRNKEKAEDPPNNVTRLYCTPSYYEQEVTATIDAQTKAPINYIVTGEKIDLPAEKWNSTLFESQMNTGRVNEFNRRRSLPLSTWPDQIETISTYPVSLGSQGTILPAMAAFAIGASQRPLEELLDPHALAAAYQSVYRIIFARSMLEILDQEYKDAETSVGHYDYVVTAIVVVPVFTYIVEGLLGLVSICGIALLLLSIRRSWGLHSDPATIASIQSLVAENPALLREFSMLDRASKDEVETNLKDKKFRLDFDQRCVFITEADNFDPVSNNVHGPVILRSEESQTAHPVRPKEFRSFIIMPFVLLQISLAISLGVLLRSSHPFGIPRPSDSPVVRQILENYIPTALATLIEPVWILLNRLLCMLQPLEELRGGNAVANRSIDADYSSLPPQLVIFKAFRSSHFKLAAVCTMALLANLLAVAFSGMFDERSALVPQTLQLTPPYQARFVDVNGTVSPLLSILKRHDMKLSGAYWGGLGINQFMVAESNYTTKNPLPAWTDHEFMYVPFMNESSYKGLQGIRGRTTAFGSTLECDTIPDSDYNITLVSKGADSYAEMGITMLDTLTNTRVTCIDERTVTRGPAPVSGRPAQCETGKLGMEFVLRSIPSAGNVTRAERDFCQQTAFFGYVRGEPSWCLNQGRNNPVYTKLDRSNSIFVGCRPKFIAGEADVQVSAEGRVEHVTERNVSTSLSLDSYKRFFTNGTFGATTAGGANDLIAQAHGYLFTKPGLQYHNDTFATDFMNYFMMKQSNTSRLLDPESPLPTLADITETLYPVYRKVFAIWLSINMDRLLVPTASSSTTVIEAQTNKTQIRIFLSKPLFVMAEIILGIYAIVAVCIYLWRPGKFLPRMPTSLGAIITLFAASEAVEDMRGTSLFTKKERKQHLKKLGATYGYGTFVGADGIPHEGIEKEPLVKPVSRLGVMEKVQTGFSQKSLGLRRGK